MKKTLITLGFAATTILAANAQEIPAAEEQPQTTVQTQPNVQDETLDTDTETMDDRALNDTDNSVTEPVTQPVRDEINDMPTESMEENAVNEPLQDEPIEDNVYGNPNTDVNSTNQESVLDDPQGGTVESEVEAFEEEAIEMQGENPNAESTMQDIPDRQSDDQSYSTVQDPSTNATNAPSAEQNKPQSDASSDKDVMTISEAELPEEVSKAFKDSEYAQASIEKVYMLKDLAVDKLLQNNAEQIYAGEQNPDRIYQLQVKSNEGRNILYYNGNGELLDSAEL